MWGAGIHPRQQHQAGGRPSAGEVGSLLSESRFSSSAPGSLLLLRLWPQRVKARAGRAHLECSLLPARTLQRAGRWVQRGLAPACPVHGCLCPSESLSWHCPETWPGQRAQWAAVIPVQELGPVNSSVACTWGSPGLQLVGSLWQLRTVHLLAGRKVDTAALCGHEQPLLAQVLPLGEELMPGWGGLGTALQHEKPQTCCRQRGFCSLPGEGFPAVLMLPMASTRPARPPEVPPQSPSSRVLQGSRGQPLGILQPCRAWHPELLGVPTSTTSWARGSSREIT